MRIDLLTSPGCAGCIYLLKRGVVKISTLTDHGKEIILALLRPGEVFGEEVTRESVNLAAALLFHVLPGIDWAGPPLVGRIRWTSLRAR